MKLTVEFECKETMTNIGFAKAIIDYDYFDLEDCEICPAKEYCDRYKDYIAERKEDEGK